MSGYDPVIWVLADLWGSNCITSRHVTSHHTWLVWYLLRTFYVHPVLYLCQRVTTFATYSGHFRQDNGQVCGRHRNLGKRYQNNQAYITYCSSHRFLETIANEQWRTVGKSQSVIPGALQPRVGVRLPNMPCSIMYFCHSWASYYVFSSRLHHL